MLHDLHCPITEFFLWPQQDRFCGIKERLFLHPLIPYFNIEKDSARLWTSEKEALHLHRTFVTESVIFKRGQIQSALSTWNSIIVFQ